MPTAVFAFAEPRESTLQQLPNIRQVQLLAIDPGALHASLLTRGNVKRSEAASATARTSTCCGRRLEKEVVSSWETCWCTKAALLGKAAGPSASTSHRGAAMASSLTMRNRWCRMRVCVLKPGLWNVSAFSDEQIYSLRQAAPRHILGNILLQANNCPAAFCGFGKPAECPRAVHQA